MGPWHDCGEKAASERGYLHGYTTKEQQRLKRQAEFLEPFIYENVDLRRVTNLLEVGCGVGAQTSILLRRFPHLRVIGHRRVGKTAGERAQGARERDQGQDASISRFKTRPARASTTAPSMARSSAGCSSTSPIPSRCFARPCGSLKAGSVIYCTEVQNASFFLQPYSPATLKYWFEFNDQQWTMHGDPFVGAKLGNLLLQAGFQNIETNLVGFHFDFRSPKRRAEFIAYWTELLLSGAPALAALEAGRPEARRADEGRAADDLARSDDSVFFYTAVQARAQAL